MKVVLLAGGLGTRLSEETHLKPKPMVEIGNRPILWHIMKTYSHFGFNEFVICCGYKGYVIKEYFANYFLHQSNVTFDLQRNEMHIHDSQAEPWKVTLVDTGLHTMTGGRIKRVREYINDAPFLLTYGDGVGRVDIRALVAHHRSSAKLLTVTAVQPSGRFGALNINDELEVLDFTEKPKGDGAWINGGYFVCQPEVIDHIEDDTTIFERAPLETIARAGQMSAYLHDGFWKPMDTLRDKNDLEKQWATGSAPWKIW